MVVPRLNRRDGEMVVIPTSKEPVLWPLLVLAAPIIASMISRTIMAFADFVMVSQIGTEAQAAVMPAGMLLFTVTGFGFGLLAAVNTYVSQSLGRDRLHECAAYTWQGFYLAGVMAILVLPLWPAARPIFDVFGHEPIVREMEID